MDQAKNMKNWVVKTKNLTAKDIEKIQQDLQTKVSAVVCLVTKLYMLTMNHDIFL